MRGELVVTAGLMLVMGLVAACGGDDEPKDDGGLSSNTAGKGGSSAGSGSVVDLGGKAAGGNAGATTGGSGGAAGSEEGNGDGGVGAESSGGSPGTVTEPCTPASTDSVPFAGSCLYDDHCTDEYDSALGVETLQQFCEGQQGTWSTGHCNPADWELKCTQESFGGVYVQFMPADGFCFDGCEEAL